MLFVLSRIKVAGPNEAFIVTGRKGRTTQTADGGRSHRHLRARRSCMGASVFVLPVVQKLQSLDLSSRRIHVEIRGAVSKQGIRADLQGVAIVKVGGTEDAIRAAAQRFLHQQDEIDDVHPGGAGRRAALDRRPADHRGDHPGPGRVRLARSPRRPSTR